MKAAIAVAFGAIIGAGLRYAIINATYVDQIWSTLVVNLVGCFVLGLVLVHGERFLKFAHSFQDVWRPFLATGLLGGFTTTSAFSVQMVELIQHHETPLFILPFIFSIFGGLFVFHIAQKFAVKRLQK